MKGSRKAVLFWGGGDGSDEFDESTLPVSVQPQMLGFPGRFL